MGGAAATWQPSALTPAALSTPRALSRFTSCACAFAILHKHPRATPVSTPRTDRTDAETAFLQQADQALFDGWEEPLLVLRAGQKRARHASSIKRRVGWRRAHLEGGLQLRERHAAVADGLPQPLHALHGAPHQRQEHLLRRPVSGFSAQGLGPTAPLPHGGACPRTVEGTRALTPDMHGAWQ